MKVKVKLDKDALLGGLIAHGEKIGFGLFVLLFLLLAIGALRQSPYDKTPEAFKLEAKRVDDRVNSAVFDPRKELDKLPSAEHVVTAEIPAERYPPGIPNNQPDSASGAQRRGEPPYLALRDLHVATGYGAVAIANRPPGGGQGSAPGPGQGPGGRPGPGPRPQAGIETVILGKQWAVVTGLIPGPQQAKEFRSAFSMAPDPKRDVPHWSRFEVERQEGDGPWTPLDLKATIAAESTQAASSDTDSVDRVYIALKEFCRPAPKLIDKSHDSSIIHPKIAQLSADRAAGRGQATVQPVANQGSAAPMAYAGNTQNREEPDQYKFDQMFRFFDYTVKPGKTYRYKVRLLLENPNHDLLRYQVKDGDLVKGFTRAAPWSESSPPVNIPSGSSMLAGGVERPKAITQESKVDFMVRKWDPALAVDALKFDQLQRGQMANYKELTNFINPKTNKVVTEEVNFQTNQTLVDLAGGGTLPSYRGRAPGCALLLNPNNELEARSELGDSVPFDAEVGRMWDLRDAAAADKKAEEERKKPPKQDRNEDERKGRGGGRSERGKDRDKGQ